MQKRVTRLEEIICVDSEGWMETGSDVSQVISEQESCTRESINWAERRELGFHKAKTAAALFTHRQGHKINLRPKLTAKIRVENGFVRCNKEVTRWLAVWMDAHLTCKEQHNRCMRIARATEAQLKELTGRYGLIPACIRALQIACDQCLGLYGSEVW